MHESGEMPKYLKVSTTTHRYAEAKKAALWLNGKTPQKVYFPDLVGGIALILFFRSIKRVSHTAQNR